MSKPTLHGTVRKASWASTCTGGMRHDMRVVRRSGTPAALAATACRGTCSRRTAAIVTRRWFPGVLDTCRLNLNHTRVLAHERTCNKNTYTHTCVCMCVKLSIQTWSVCTTHRLCALRASPGFSDGSPKNLYSTQETYLNVFDLVLSHS